MSVDRGQVGTDPYDRSTLAACERSRRGVATLDGTLAGTRTRLQRSSQDDSQVSRSESITLSTDSKLGLACSMVAVDPHAYLIVLL